MSCAQFGSPGPDCCSDAEMYPEQVCVDSECAERCSESTDAGESPCTPEHPCILHPAVEEYICDPLCHDEGCPARQECDSVAGDCFAPDQCGSYVPCLDGTKICDVILDKCFPRNGDCSSGQGCPYFGADVQAVAEIHCDESALVCTAQRRVASNDWFTEGTSGSIPIHTPDPVEGTVFATGDDVQFSWDPQPFSVLLRAFDRLPIDNSSFEDGLVWGASVPKGGPHTLSWNQGFRFSQGNWIAGTPLPLEPGIYYFAVIGVDGGQKKRVSSFVPFAVGASNGFDEVNSPCSQEGTPGDCASLSQPVTCYQGTCRRLCASHLDCEPNLCEDPQNGRRMCGT